MDPKTLNQGARSIVAPDFHFNRLSAVIVWLEANQPDVFRRGVWEAINTADKLTESQRQALQGLSDSAFPAESKEQL